MTAVGDPRTDDPAALRRGGDALAGASIGTVPILWLNTATVHPSGATDAALDEREYAGRLMVEQDRSPRPPSASAAIGRRTLATSLRRLGRATPVRTAS